jgi:predicted Zn finger-like uncharacterized protein
MASGRYIACPQCGGRFFVGEEFFELSDARCHCPYCGHQFSASEPDAAAATSPPAQG